VPPGIGRNDEEDDVDVSPFSESEIFVAANLVHVARCFCRRSSCFFSARAAFFLLLTKCWCCAVVVVAKDISFILRVSLCCAMFFLGKSDIYPNTHEPSLAVLREAQRALSAEGGCFPRRDKKTQKRSCGHERRDPYVKMRKRTTGAFLGEINRVCVLRVLSLSLSSLNAHMSPKAKPSIYSTPLLLRLKRNTTLSPT